MPTTPLSFQELLARAEGGSHEAAHTLMQEYGNEVLRAVRRHLPQALRREFDSIDFTQAVWGSFFTRPNQAEMPDDPEQLLRLLVRMARHKVLMALRKKQSTKRQQSREVEEHALRPAEALAPDPTPSQVAVANDLCRKLTEGYSDRHREILEYRLQGRSREEIAQLLGMNERIVRRVLDRMGQALGGDEPDER